ncbi:TlpA family protein disulfide reductase [Alteromonas sediminis]|uniref:TlpA family protein disulfide reductase n=1 Tax=Alteromonas sediminis TaxID=2259342 RepID=A0A3N5Z779_9ALTE|nr:TlpA disulfide reductase family protein [Alteromonas sediminis]RPJ66544.1 TlpA family protein disulfide reductase [Alteromonas sediminis]
MTPVDEDKAEIARIFTMIKNPYLIALINILIALIISYSKPVTAQSVSESERIGPDFLFTPEKGGDFYFNDRLQETQRPIFLYFWASWCPYCKKATPRVVALHQQFSGYIDVLAINVGINDSVEKMRAYMSEYNMTFPVMFDTDSEISSTFHVFGTPVFIIFSTDGEIMYRSHQYPEGIERALSVPVLQENTLEQSKGENVCCLIHSF